MQPLIRHFTIPVFIPMQGCPFDCVFCNQRHISGQRSALTDNEIIEKIENHLKTLPAKNSKVEVGFFGGSFTGLSIDDQLHYLSLVQPWVKNGRINGVRLSTRPDYIQPEILDMLKRNHVSAIELGVQSMDDEVLRLAGRGHTSGQVRRAAAMIKESGFSLGLQMMTGLPGDTLEKSMNTAQEIIALSADSTRVYPALVIRHTHLEKIYNQQKYLPLSLEEAIDWCSQIVPLFEAAIVRILRLGLHPSEGLLHGNELVAGPFHVAFGEMVYSKIWHNLFCDISPEPDAEISIFVHPRQLNQAVGHGAANKKMLKTRFRKVNFRTDNQLTGRAYYVHHH